MVGIRKQSVSVIFVFFFLVFFLVAAAICSPAQTFTTLVNFDGTNGALPEQMSLVQGVDGNFYGTTFGGGNYACVYGCGTVFSITPSGVLNSVHDFAGSPGDGFYPYGGVVLATDGNFYGTTYSGGGCKYCGGIVYKMTAAGDLTILHTFALQNRSGTNPEAGLVQSSNGDLYGTDSLGGENPCDGLGCGAVFKITPDKVFTPLHSFDGLDGNSPYAGLVQGANGNFYGTTYKGGSNHYGTVFEISPDGILTSLHSFDGADGAYPYTALVAASDGNLYGTTTTGGAYEGGTLFKITVGGQLTTIYNFCTLGGCTDGSGPMGALIEGTDGNFYGTTLGGGANGGGTLFSVTRGGKFTPLHSFDSDDFPSGGLVEGTDGSFYGTTLYGGGGVCNNAGCGTVFNISVGLAAFARTLPSSGNVGTRFVILGDNLTGAISVNFNGVSAPFTVVSSTEIKAMVPSGATTGFIYVVTPAGTFKSNVKFRVP
jgi:uncharacterized repeat protein (TIGR03803 family)